VWLSTIDRMQNGPSYNSSAAMKPEQSERAQSRCSVQFRRAAFFPPGLDPIRDRGRRDEHAVVTPEGPTGGAVGQAVLDDQANGRVAHPAGVVTTGCGEVGGVGVEVLAAAGTVMLGSEDDEIGCDRASAKDFHEIRAVFTRGVA